MLNEARNQREVEVILDKLLGYEKETGCRSGRFSPNEIFTLEYWLIMNRSSTASDPRDKVFGVLGILQDHNHASFDLNGFNIDYKASVQDVYSSAVKSILGAVGTLDILTRCSPKTALVSRSWTPDWTNPPQKSYLPKYPRSKTIFTSSANTCFQGHISSDLDVLEVTGMIWDVIESAFTLKRHDTKVSSLSAVCTRIWDHMKSGTAYESELEAKKAFWRSLVIAPDQSTRRRDHQDPDRVIVPQVIVDLVKPDYFDKLKDWPQWPAADASCWSHGDILRSVKKIWPDERTIVITQKGYIGQALYTGRLQPGDAICVLLGSSVPLVLRPVDSHYVLIGDIYLDGIMHGEAMKALEEGKFQLQKFPIH